MDTEAGSVVAVSVSVNLSDDDIALLLHDLSELLPDGSEALAVAAPWDRNGQRRQGETLGRNGEYAHQRSLRWH